MVLDGVSEREVVVPGGRDIPVLDESVVEVAVERLLYVGHVLDGRYRAHRDLLATVVVGHWRRHDVAGFNRLCKSDVNALLRSNL